MGIYEGDENMSIIKSFSVGDGDMFYIEHNSDSFSIIDCNLDDNKKDEILDEICKVGRNKGIMRFISTHPDEDHFHGIELLDKRFYISNFYCVRNEATKQDVSKSFRHYCNLRDDIKRVFYIYKDCRRKWINENNEERSAAGINILWPDTENAAFKKQLKIAKDGGCANNISPIIQYSLNSGVVALWFGDLESKFMETICDEVSLPQADIIFAPHHGRNSGKLPSKWLSAIAPKVIVIGEADSTMLEYYKGYNTITQNSAHDIVFECDTGKVHVFVSNANYSVDYLIDERHADRINEYYIGSFNTHNR